MKSWKDVPFWKGQVIMEGGKNELELMALLTDRSLKDIKESEKFEDVYYAVHNMQFLSELPDFRNPILPETITIDEKEYKLPHIVSSDPFDLGKSITGQIKDMEMQLRILRKQFHGEEEKDLTELEAIKMTPYVVAIYIQKIIDKEYDYHKAMSLVEKVSTQMSFYDVTMMGYFFFMRLNALKNGYPKTLLNQNYLQRRLRRVLGSLAQYFRRRVSFNFSQA